MVERDPDSTVVYERLAEVNRMVAARNNFVSEACWVVHARLTGDGGGRGFGLEGRPFMPRMAFPAGTEDVIRKLVAEQFGDGMGSIVGISTVRAEATEEYHQTQLREKPGDPNVHSNYGAFLVAWGHEDEAEGNIGWLSPSNPTTRTPLATSRTSRAAEVDLTRRRTYTSVLLPQNRVTKTSAGTSLASCFGVATRQEPRMWLRLDPPRTHRAAASTS
jgi:hypothetical protein